MDWTKERIWQGIENSQTWLEKAILTLYDRQTDLEKSIDCTYAENGIGFNGIDANYFSYLAKWIQSGRHLSGEHLARAKKRIKKYCGQLARIANEKQTQLVS